VSEVETVVTDEFMDKGGVAAEYFEARVFPGDIMNQMLVFMNENQATGEDAAFEFLIQHEDIWSTWVAEDVATKVKDAL
jgi:glycine betaine/proline transport system substrate-binding protein